MRKTIFLTVAVLLLIRTVDVTAQTNGNTENQIAVNVSSTVNGAGAYYIEQSEFKGGYDIWANASVSGDFGSNVSYFADIGVSLLYAERKSLGKWPIKVGSTEKADVFSYPLGYFPYSYKGPWDGFVFPLEDLGGDHGGWPDASSIGFSMLCGISGTAFNDVLLWRIGRNEHEVAGMVEGSSLVLNKSAQPFFGFDIEVKPVPWLRLYSLSGILEYYNADGIQESSARFQNAFSLSMFTVLYKQYIRIDAGSSAIWPKRFELGYLFPLTFPLLYQNNTGDFDNLSIFGNIKLQLKLKLCLPPCPGGILI